MRRGDRPGSRLRPRMRTGRPAAARGFTLIGVVVVLALVMLGLSIAGPAWSQQQQRDRERQLLRIGALYAQAIADYHDSSPGSLKQYPETLQALLLDTRFVGVRRHLRTLYADPMDPARPWGLLRGADGRIVGVFSTAPGVPVAQGALDLGAVQLPPAKQYADWKFIAKVNP